MAAARCLELREQTQFRDDMQVKLFLELRRMIVSIQTFCESYIQR
jgi:hypothetical protein